MSKVVGKASGVNTSWKLIYDSQLIADASKFTIDNIQGDKLDAIKIIISGSVAANAGSHYLVFNDDRTVGAYDFVGLKANAISAIVTSDTTTMRQFPLATDNDFWLSGSIFTTEATIITSSDFSSGHIIKSETAVINSTPYLLLNSGQWSDTSEITKIVIGGDDDYDDVLGDDTFRFGAGTRCQILGMSR